MFLGEYQHTVDAKGRVILPAKFRDQLEDGAVIATMSDRCLAVYPPERWMEVAQRAREGAALDERRRKAARALFAGASEVSPDRQGRIAIPPNLRQYAGIERDVVVTGTFDHIEIWDADAWSAQKTEGEGQLAEAAELPEMGW